MTTPLAKPANLPYVAGTIPDGFVNAAQWYTYFTKPVGDALDRLIGDTDWHFDEPSLYADWTNFGSGSYSDFGYRKNGDLVNVCGLVSNGSVGIDTPIAVLPPRYRPNTNLAFTSICGGTGVARVVMASTGQLYVSAFNTGGTNSYVSLEGLWWAAGTP